MSQAADNSSQRLALSTRDPYLKGTVLDSILIDTSQVRDVKTFFKDLADYCGGSSHLWYVKEQPRTEGKRIFVEAVVSSLMREQMCCKDGFHLPSFNSPFYAFDSLSSDDDIVKIQLSNLPPQYGRLDGGYDELKQDILNSAVPF
ncbi:hypothetical protein BDF20DRAFT_825359 [Mycotypha africana]|uniref:uncharacterized protein n=1 Tax=Mycotypha africana TaxID=64632 RepID=UPI00230052A6|nr:uncharacterized protein BDF20DRAFT_825359 [Mycotypha africana]KAI8971519.1 hypothetical protein BDF20DRAFT_825359 [Mycotypha africana]